MALPLALQAGRELGCAIILKIARDEERIEFLKSSTVYP
jgi:hypothetical protein